MIKTLKDVICSEQGKAIPYKGKVIGQINNLTFAHGRGIIIVTYEYLREDLEPLMSGNKVFTFEEANNLHQQIKTSLRNDLSYVDSQKELFYTAFKIEMANTFGVLLNEIENI